MAQEIQMWKLKKLIKGLDSAKGAGPSSMISLILPPNDEISRASAMLTQEYATAASVKSRLARPPGLAAITMTQQRLKLYNRVPPNGLVLFVGTVLTDEGREKKVIVDFEPYKPIKTFLYLCDIKFHTEALSELLELDSRFGFIVIDGNYTLFGTLAGHTREVIHEFAVDPPKKHGRGGGSALRFPRREELKRRNYMHKIAEHAMEHFITNDKVNVKGFVLAGTADFKTALGQNDMLDLRLAAKIIAVVDVSYGGENGFNQAIELAAELLANAEYFEESSQDTGRCCFGIENLLKALDLGAIETLIAWENLDITRYTLRNAAGDEIIVHSNKEQENNREKFLDESTGLEMEQTSEPQSLLEWFAEKCKDLSVNFEFVTDRSQEGTQFVKEFGGIAALLRYKVDFANLESTSDRRDEVV
ncbi:peptide chain release factor eRF/aRF subunit 1 [Mycena alexandri]|uniref:Peptide chain release factor eRF/aRF subunit 1 n=1 Tax=Mycena alexandri TaxID=1745969 RepID=A0AAD6X5L3_9AGAR|nr:peptide chain release factor eRF/aRF subunit 1 [Mycena alexandri]